MDINKIDLTSLTEKELKEYYKLTREAQKKQHNVFYENKQNKND